MAYSSLLVHFDPGKIGNRVAVILKCPGQDECESQHPAAGRTGASLKGVFRLINEMVQNNVDALSQELLPIFNDFCYEPDKPQTGVMVSNAYPMPYYKNGPNGADVPLDIPCKHVRVMADSISDKRVVICFGIHAARLYNRICDADCCKKMICNQDVIKCCHLSFKCQNILIKYDVQHRPILTGESDASERRREVIAKYIFLRLAGQITSQISFGTYLEGLKPKT